MKISIVIPTYNCGQYIKRAIDSALGQPYIDKEIIVVDGGSNDNTVEILKSYQGAIKWVSEKDNGQADAINKGFKMATGDIVAWLNADDYYESDIFSNIVVEFERDNSIVLVYGKCRSVSLNSSEINIPPLKVTFRKMINNGNFIYQPSSFYRLDAVREANYLDDTLDYWMEYDLCLKLLGLGKLRYFDQILSNFMIREDQKSDLKNRLAMNKELWLTAKRHGASFLSRIYFSNLLFKLKNVVWPK